MGGGIATSHTPMPSHFRTTFERGGGGYGGQLGERGGGGGGANWTPIYVA